MPKYFAFYILAGIIRCSLSPPRQQYMENRSHFIVLKTRERF